MWGLVTFVGKSVYSRSGRMEILRGFHICLMKLQLDHSSTLLVTYGKRVGPVKVACILFD